MDKENKLILYNDENGKLSVNVRFADDDVWLTQAQLAEIYQTTQQNISLHLQGIYGDKELDDDTHAALAYIGGRRGGSPFQRRRTGVSRQFRFLASRHSSRGTFTGIPQTSKGI